MGFGPESYHRELGRSCRSVSVSREGGDTVRGAADTWALQVSDRGAGHRALGHVACCCGAGLLLLMGCCLLGFGPKEGKGF